MIIASIYNVCNQLGALKDALAVCVNMGLLVRKLVPCQSVLNEELVAGDWSAARFLNVMPSWLLSQWAMGVFTCTCISGGALYANSSGSG